MERKLTAILSADVKGYSRLMGEDEVATIRTLTAYREVMASLIQQHRGRVIDMPGDNLLAEFASVVDAVQCAVEIQRKLKGRNAELPDHRRMGFRIGINLGDVVVDRERIYGDGVNIAARVEGLAEGGGICISGTAYDHVRNKLAVGYESLGEHTVKNIAEPVRVYKVLLEPGQAPTWLGKVRRTLTRSERKVALAAATVVLVALVAALAWNLYRQSVIETTLADFKKEVALPLPDRPSIAVLAFDNLSGDPEQEYFSDGLSDDIITKLASLSPLFVVARNSSFQYKGKQVDIRQIGRELGVRYVLEGSVRKSAERVRITAQLIDAATGKHLFAKQYDRELKDIFVVQEEIANQVLAEIHVKFGVGEIVSHILRSTSNFEAFDAFMRGTILYERGQKEANFQAEELLLKAIELDPKFASAMGALGWVYMTRARQRWVSDPKQAYRLSEEWAQRAIEVDPNNPSGLVLMSRFQSLKGNHEEAIAMGKRGVELRPSHAPHNVVLAFSYLLARQPQAALETINKAKRLAPYPPPYFHLVAGRANRWSGNHEVAVSEYNEVLGKLTGGPARTIATVGLIISLMNLGEDDQAKAVADKLINANPSFTISSYQRRLKNFPYKDFNWLEEDAEILRKVGLPQ